MRSLLNGRRGDIALGIAVVSLFASLGGPSWAAGLINGQRLQAKTVTGKKLKPRAVTNSRLGSNAVTGSKIKNGAVASVDVANGSLAREDVTPDFFAGLQTALGPGSVFESLLAVNAITTGKIADRAVTGVKLDPGAVSNSRLLNNAVTSSKIDDGTVAGADLADGAVSSAKILDSGIATADLADDAVTTAKIARNGVTGGDLDATGAAALDFASIADGACASAPVALTGADVADDAIVVTPPVGFAGSGVFAVPVDATSFEVRVCNYTGSAVEPDGTYRWVAIQG